MRPRKIGLMVAGMVALMLTGCGGEPDPRVTTLERRVSQLEARVKQYEEGIVGITNRLNHISEISKAQKAGLESVQDMAEDSATRWKELERLTIELAVRQSNKPSLVDFTAKARKLRHTNNVWPILTPVTLKDWVPEAVYNDIMARARREWPNDYAMQKFVIDRELQAYKRRQSEPQTPGTDRGL